MRAAVLGANDGLVSTPSLTVGVAAASAKPSVVLVALACLALLGVAGAKAGGAPPWRAAARVTFWGALAMIVTAGIGRLVGAAI